MLFYTTYIKRYIKSFKDDRGLMVPEPISPLMGSEAPCCGGGLSCICPLNIHFKFFKFFNSHPIQYFQMSKIFYLPYQKFPGFRIPLHGAILDDTRSFNRQWIWALYSWWNRASENGGRGESASKNLQGWLIYDVVVNLKSPLKFNSKRPQIPRG